MKKKNSPSLVAILFAFVWIVVGYFSYHWYIDCWKNHSKVLKTIGKPMEEQVLSFFKEHQKYPTFEEAELFIKELGCSKLKTVDYLEFKNMKGEVYTKITDYSCEYNSIEIGFAAKIGSTDNPYSVRFYRGGSGCSVRFESDGTFSGGGLDCLQASCLLKNLSH